MALAGGEAALGDWEEGRWAATPAAASAQRSESHAAKSRWPPTFLLAKTPSGRDSPCFGLRYDLERDDPEFGAKVVANLLEDAAAAAQGAVLIALKRLYDRDAASPVRSFLLGHPPRQLVEWGCV